MHTLTDPITIGLAIVLFVTTTQWVFREVEREPLPLKWLLTLELQAALWITLMIAFWFANELRPVLRWIGIGIIFTVTTRWSFRIVQLMPLEPASAGVLASHRRSKWYFIMWLNATVPTVVLIALSFPENADQWIVRTCWQLMDTAFIPLPMFYVCVMFIVLLALMSGVLSRRLSTICIVAGVFLERAFLMIGTFLFCVVTAQSLLCVTTVFWPYVPRGPFALGSLGNFLFALMALALIMCFRAVQPVLRAIDNSIALSFTIIAPYVPLLRRMVRWPQGSDRLCVEWSSGIDPSPADTTIVILSDLHLTDRPKHLVPTDRTSKQTIDCVEQLLNGKRPVAVFLGGDVTDLGARSTWNMAETMFANQLVFLVPGNHDYHFKRILSQTLFVKPSFDESEVLTAVKRDSRTLDSVQGYPYCVRSEALKLVLVCLDSNKRASTTPITNALGSVGNAQLSEASRQLKALRQPGDAIIVMLHHHVLTPPFNVGSAFLRCVDATKVLKFALRADALAIIHGHKHMPYVYRYPKAGGGELFIVSCGSAHYPAGGPFAQTVIEPSCYELSILNGRIRAVDLIRLPTCTKS